MRSRKRKRLIKSDESSAIPAQETHLSHASLASHDNYSGAANAQSAMVQMQRQFGNKFVRHQMIQRDLFGISEMYKKATSTASSGFYMLQRDHLLKQIRDITRQEISRFKKRRHIAGLLNELTSTQKKRLAHDQEFLTRLRHTVSRTLYQELEEDIQTAASGGTITAMYQTEGGTLTIVEGPLEILELDDIDPDMVELELDLRDPSRQKEIASVLQQVRAGLGTTKQLTSVLNSSHKALIEDSIAGLPERGKLLEGTTLSASVHHAHVTLGLVDKVLTAADPKDRQAYLKKLKETWGHGATGKSAVLTEVLKTGIEGVTESISAGALIAYGVAKVSGNQVAIERATSWLTKATELKFLKYAGPVADGLSILNGVSVMLDSEADFGDRVKGGVDTTTGALGIAGTLLGERAAWANPLGISIAVTYEGMDLLAKHVYSATLTSTTEIGLLKAYRNLHGHLRALGKTAIVCEHWFKQWIRYYGSNEPEDQLKAGMAMDRLIETLPAMQRELRKTLEYATRERYKAINKPFLESDIIEDNLEFALMDVNLSPDLVTVAAMKIVQEVFTISTMLYADYKNVLESAVQQNLDYYKRHRAF